jgi:hypothetical protein
MQINQIGAEQFPGISESYVRQIAVTGLDLPIGSIAVCGGAARSALVEATIGEYKQPRDWDFFAVGEKCPDATFLDLNDQLSPEDSNGAVARVSEVNDWLEQFTDFTINQGVLLHGTVPVLHVARSAISACVDRLIIPTPQCIQETINNAENAATDKVAKTLYLRSRTNMPAKAAYLVAGFRASGIDFDYDMLDHPRPSHPNDTHRFYLGIMVRKSLMVDQQERGEGDISATKIMFELFREMKMVGKFRPRKPEDIIKYCESVHRQNRHLQFYGSAIADLVQHRPASPDPAYA